MSSSYEHVRDTMARLEREGRHAEAEELRAFCRAETAIELPPIVLDEPVATLAPVPFAWPR